MSDLTSIIIEQDLRKFRRQHRRGEVASPHKRETSNRAGRPRPYAQQRNRHYDNQIIIMSTIRNGIIRSGLTHSPSMKINSFNSKISILPKQGVWMMKTKTTFLTFLIFLNLFCLNVFAQNVFTHTSFDGHSASVNSVAYSPILDSDGKSTLLASGSDDETVRLWNARTGQVLKRLIGHGGDVNSVAFSPDGQTLASGSRDDTVRLWDTKTGEHLNTLTGHTNSVNSVAFSPDGQTLASGSRDDTVRLWDTKTGEHLNTLTGHTNSVNSVAFSPDGQTIASGSGDATTRLWNPRTGQILKTFKSDHTYYVDAVTSVAFSPDGQTLASGSLDWAGASTLRLWNVRTGEKINLLHGGAGTEVYSVAFSPDGQTLASGSKDGTRLWDARTGEYLNTFTGGSGSQGTSVAFSPDGQTLARGHHSGTINIFDVNTGEHQQSFEGHLGDIRHVQFVSNGTELLSLGSDKTLRLWNATTGAHIKLLKVLDYNRANRIALSNDEQKFASTNNEIIHLWNADTWEQLNTLTGHDGDVYGIAFSPDGQTLASGSSDGTIRLWDTNTGEHKQTLIGHGGAVNTVIYSPDGQTLASGSSDGTIRLWDTNIREHKQTLIGHGGVVTTVAFSPDGQTLASGSGGSDNFVRLWNVNIGKTLKILTGYKGYANYINSVAFSPDGKTLAVARAGGTTRLWDMRTGGRLKVLGGHGSRINTVAFSPDGQTLATGGEGRSIRLWDLPDTRVTLSPNPIVPPAIGEKITLNVDIAAGTNIFGYAFTIGFDPNVLRYVESANGNYLPGAFTVPPDAAYGTVKLSSTALTAWGNGDGTLATVTFEVIDVTESVIYLYDLSLTDTAEQILPSYVDSAYIEPALIPSAAVASLTPNAVDSPAVGENLVLNVDIAGGDNLAKTSFLFHYDTATLKFIAYNQSDYFTNGGTGDGTLGTVTFQVIDVENSTIGLTGYLVATNGLRYLPTFGSANVIVPLLGDVNRDGRVNILDLVVVANSFGQTVSETGNPADVNEDGFINLLDLVKVAGAMGNQAAAPHALLTSTKVSLTRSQVQQWITQAQQLNLTDPTSQRGIRFLEQLLAALTPKETALLANYPNPFNPETWIPYQLATPADVSISVYAADGTLVRTLDLGHQPVGMYQERSRAAHWDGKNAQGESVASGVYFYTLTANDFTATRKMLIIK